MKPRKTRKKMKIRENGELPDSIRNNKAEVEENGQGKRLLYTEGCIPRVEEGEAIVEGTTWTVICLRI